MAVVYKKGTQRTYQVTTPSPNDIESVKLTTRERFTFLPLVIFTIWIRTFNLDYPDSVVFDELHFGGFARKYLMGEFFMDVHPPLVKLIYAAIAHFNHYDLFDFDFGKIGLAYKDSNTGELLAPYVSMRAFPALCGVSLVLLAYHTLRSSGCRHFVALFGAFLVAIENSLVSQSRFILLDSPLLFGIGITVYAFKQLEISVPFSRRWDRYVLFTGIGLGLSISSKWVGLFTVLWVGICTLDHLWLLVGDLEVSPKQIVKHIYIKLYYWICLPLVMYLMCFTIHFAFLPNYSEGGSLMSTRFQAGLFGSNLNNIDSDISYGSTVTLRHFNTGAYLHSHNHTYPKSGNQQVTLYGFRDLNNQFFVEKTEKSNIGELVKNTQFLKDSSKLRLFHNTTEKYLHVSDLRPPISEQEYNNEVSVIGDAEFLGTVDENFQLQIVQEYSKPGEAQKKVKPIDTVFQLKHLGTQCTLFAHDVKLPAWGFRQLEVTCVEKPTLLNTLWYIETSSHPLLESAQKVEFEPMSFLEKLWELHKVMWRTNAGLTDSHTYASDPLSWPVLLRGVSYWDKENKNIYYLGNFLIYWTTTSLIVVYMLYKFVKVVTFNPFRYGRSVKVDQDETKYDSQVLCFIIGWFVHFAPSLMMKRQMFLHHYLPSLYFAILITAQTFEFIISNAKKLGYLVMIVTAAGCAVVFYSYAPIIYGLDWTKQGCEEMRILGSYDIPCGNYIN
ncbi:unnamed protein product [Kuraishia capsulata CBS 1993]|uniref:Dolichyl-phosphate-mannose--protein mannosyltransferase n=1 Tax=Kuraishia capsulata CBS 1993 TaxID=1382522 RepID=W6MTN8_9ASCO|nr:uncharacterized protein KUCA_T00004555001 [Kuraishia capsulata CBS 1993]CDK28572.1 unnamed protein product [Kuraishia capsulata CBS 1993]